MNSMSRQAALGMSLVLLSVACYGLHYLLFRDAHHIFIYLVGDIAFVFIEVLLVSIIIPYLYSLAMRTNPFDENASPVVA